MYDLDLLRIETMIAMIREFEPEDLAFTRAGILPRVESRGQDRTWDILGVPRDISTFEGKTAPATPRKLQVIGNRTSRLARTFKSARVPGSVLIDLRAPGTSDTRLTAENEIARALRDGANLLDRQNEFMIAKALQGSLTIKIDGLDHTINYGIPTANIFGLALPDPQKIAIAWNDPSSNIPKDVRRIRRAVSTGTGRIVRHAWCTEQTIEALIQNDFVSQYFQSTPAGVQALTEGTIARFWGMSWHEIPGTYIDDAGVVQRFMPDGRIVFTPEPSEEWGHFDVGSDYVPNDDRRGIREVVGRYAYPNVDINPAAVQAFYGEVRLPILRIPGAVGMADVF